MQIKRKELKTKQKTDKRERSLNDRFLFLTLSYRLGYRENQTLLDVNELTEADQK